MTSRARAFTFTINNDTFDDLKTMIDYSFRYLIFGFEIGKRGTPHIQGYVYLHNAKTLDQLKKKMLPRAHIEYSRGTAKQNAEYVAKLETKVSADDWYEFGERPQQGHALWEHIEDVMEDPMINPHVWNQYHKMYRHITLTKKKDHKRRLYVIEESKQYEIASHYDSVCVYPSEYDGERIVILPTYCETQKIASWIRGFPPKYRNGYELLIWDPEVVYILYNDAKDYNSTWKTFENYIDF